MPITFDSALGIHQNALAVWAHRAELLASNLANADTPGYKARDVDFKSALADVQAGKNDGLSITHTDHMQSPLSVDGMELLYRIPNQPSVDGNSVDSQMEKSAFAENALHYQASLSFLNGKFKGLLAAIKGE